MHYCCAQLPSLNACPQQLLPCAGCAQRAGRTLPSSATHASCAGARRRKQGVPRRNASALEIVADMRRSRPLRPPISSPSPSPVYVRWLAQVCVALFAEAELRCAFLCRLYRCSCPYLPPRSCNQIARLPVIFVLRPTAPPRLHSGCTCCMGIRCMTGWWSRAWLLPPLLLPLQPLQ